MANYKRKTKKKGRGIVTNADKSKTLLKGKKGKNAKAVSLWFPKGGKKVLVTTKRWVTKKQARQY